MARTFRAAVFFFILLAAGTADAKHALVMIWDVQAAAGGGFDYTFRLTVASPFSGQVDGIRFADNTLGSDSSAQGMVNPVLVGLAPGPYTMMTSSGSAGGPFAPTFYKPPGWNPPTIGASLMWKVHADNLIGDDNMFWSYYIGDDPKADAEFAFRSAYCGNTDLDGDSVNDFCDHDVDNDGVLNFSDNCPPSPNLDQADVDSDSIGDACDNCPAIFNTNQPRQQRQW